MLLRRNLLLSLRGSEAIAIRVLHSLTRQDKSDREYKEKWSRGGALFKILDKIADSA